MQFVTVKSSHYQSDLVVLKSRLESEGIDCRLKNELTAQVLNHIPSFLVELQVPEKDLPKVEEILIETGELQMGNTKFACPKCGSQKVRLKLNLTQKVKLYSSMMYSALAMSNVPMHKLIKSPKYHCPDCGNEFF